MNDPPTAGVRCRAAQVPPRPNSRADLDPLLALLPAGDDVRQRTLLALEEAETQTTTTPLLLATCKSWLLARLLLLREVAYASEGHTLCDTICLGRSEHGQPITDGYVSSNTHFSVSHTEEWVCCVRSTCGRVGVDIVTLTHDQHDRTPWRAAFTNWEWGVLTESPTLEGITFAFLWSVKESVLKTLGYGFASEEMEPRDVEVRLDRPLSESDTAGVMPLPLWIKSSEAPGWAARCHVLAGDTPSNRSLLTVILAPAENERAAIKSLEHHFQCVYE